ncbi:MAG: hypothetical protein ACK41E_10000 [Deinococcales bacterium]
MKLVRFKTVFLALAILAAVVGLGSLLVSSILTRGAVFAQLAQENEAAELFGDTSQKILIGSPQNFLALAPEAFFEGKGDQDARLINSDYLRENNIYPIQVKTVEFFRNLTLLVSAVGGALMLVLWRLAQRKSVVRG